MLLFGFRAEDHTCDPPRMYDVLATGDGRLIHRYGNLGENGQIKTSTKPTADDAADSVRDFYRDLVVSGSYEQVGLFSLATVRDGLATRDLPSVLIGEHDAIYDEGCEHVIYEDLERTVTTFCNLAGPGTGRSAPATAVVSDRAEPLTLPEGESVTRPNGETYLPRDLGGHTDVAALRSFPQVGLFALLEGLPGCGKTALAEASFPDLVSVQCHGDMTVAHLVGTHLPTAEGGWRWNDGPLTRAMREGLTLYLDEINAMPPDVSTVLHSALDGRRMLRLDDRPDAEVVTAADGFYVLGAYNPDTLGGAGLPEALVSRFPVQIEVDTDADAARRLGVPEVFMTIAGNLTSRNATAIASGQPPVWVPQMRELLAAQRLVDTGLGEAFAASAMLAQCPRPEDVPIVADIAGQALGVEVAPLRLGAQV